MMATSSQPAALRVSLGGIWPRPRPAPSLSGQRGRGLGVLRSLGAKACPSPGSGRQLSFPSWLRGKRAASASGHTLSDQPLPLTAAQAGKAGYPQDGDLLRLCPRPSGWGWGWGSSGSWACRGLVSVGAGPQVLENPWRPGWAKSWGGGGWEQNWHMPHLGVWPDAGPLDPITGSKGASWGLPGGGRWSATGGPGHEGHGDGRLWLQ